MVQRRCGVLQRELWPARAVLAGRERRRLDERLLRRWRPTGCWLNHRNRFNHCIRFNHCNRLNRLGQRRSCMRLQSLPLLTLLLAVACGDAGDSFAEDSFVDEDPPMGGCESGGTGPCGSADDKGAAAAGEPCDDTNQCGSGLACAAPFASGDPGPLVCQNRCIGPEDPAFWCSDDASCCSGTCGPRGLCSDTSGTG